MVRLLALLSFCLLGAETALPACRLSHGAESDINTKVILENDWVRAEILPKSCGRVGSFILKSTGEELLAPLEENRVEVSPLLPPSVRSNGGGFKDWLWGIVAPSGVPFTLTILTDTQDEIVISLQGELAVFDVTKVIRLRKNSAVLEQEITLRNPASHTMKADYWAHLLLNPSVFLTPPPAKGFVALAMDESTAVVRGKKTETSGRKEVTTGEIASSYHFLAPLEPWVARVSPRSGTALILSSPKLEDGTLASVWQSDAASSLEVVFPSRDIPPGGTASYHLDLAALPGAGQILGMLGSFVICGDGENVVLRTLREHGPSNWTFPLWKAGKQEISVPQLQVFGCHEIGNKKIFGLGEVQDRDQKTSALFSPAAPVHTFSTP